MVRRVQGLGFFRGYPKGPSTYQSYTLLNLELHNYYPKPKYLIIGSFGPLGLGFEVTRVRIFDPKAAN